MTTMQYISNETARGYEIQSEVGHGGFGVVYKAVEVRPTFSKEVAIKVIAPQHANKPDFVRRFEREAQTVARLEHPHIVPLYDYWRSPEGAFMVMRYLHGGSAKDMLKDSPLEIETAGLLLQQICAALSFAHRQGVIHRDIKPNNILLDEDGNAYLTDFGIAKDFANMDFDSLDDSFKGTPGYMATEQLKGDPVTPHSDVYSLGVTLYELLEGHHPFPNANFYDQIFKLLNEPLPMVTGFEGELNDAINEVIQCATAKNPADRYADAKSFLDAFHDAAKLNLPTAPASMVEALTRRQQEILGLIIQGKTNKEISQELVIAFDTVKWHIRQIYKTLKVRNRNQAIIKAQELDLLYGDDLEGMTYMPDTSHTSGQFFDEVENPYKGLKAFSEADVKHFYGRERLTQKLLQRMQEGDQYRRFLVILGPSGSGKSSLVKAGLIPAVWRGEIAGSDEWVVTTMLPGAHPLDELDVALKRVAANYAGNVMDTLAQNDRGLVKVAQLILPDDDSELLLVIDQFEELFTLVEDEATRVHFLNLLQTTITDPRSRVRIVVTLRADFYDRPLLYPEFGELVRHRVETVLPLSTSEIEQAIVEPSKRLGIKYEDGLVANIMGDVNYQAGALPLLQYALTELFERRDGRIITHSAYQAIGGTIGALANRADELCDQMSAEGQGAVRQIFMRLVTLGKGTEDTRRRTRRGELLAIGDNPDLTDDIINIFAEYRLLSLDHDPSTREPTVEVAHEAILREWERLREWLNDSREDIKLQRQLAALATAWKANGQDESFLVRGTRLEQLQLWSLSTELAMTPTEMDFLSASGEADERREVEKKAQIERERKLELRARKILQGLVAVFLVASVVAIGLAVFAFAERSTAQEERNRAQTERDRAESAEQEALELAGAGLAAQALAELDGPSPERSILLALKALEYFPYTPQAESALALAVEEYRPSRVLRTDGSQVQILVAAWSPSGDRIAAGGTSSPNSLVILDVNSGSELLATNVIDCIISSIAWSPNGTKIVAAGQTCQTVTIVDTLTGAIVLTLEDNDEMVISVDWSPDGSAIATPNADGSVIIWDAATGSNRMTLLGHDETVRKAVWSSSGDRIATVSDDGLIKIWDAESGTGILTLPRHIGAVADVAWSPDGLSIVTGGADGLLRLWDVQSGEPLVSFAGHSGAIIALDWSADGTQISSQSNDSSVRVWDTATGIERFEIPNVSHINGYVEWSPDDQWLLASNLSLQGQIWLWSTATSVPLLIGHTNIQESGSWSPDNSLIATGGADNTLRVWDAKTGQQQTILQLPGGARFIDWSPDSTRIVTPVAINNYKVWNIETGEVVLEMNGDAPIFSRWSPDGSRILGTSKISGETAWNIYIWDADTGEELMRFLEPHNCLPSWPDWSPDSSKIVAGCMAVDDIERDSPARIWDAESFEELALLESNHGWSLTTDWSPDGSHIAISYIEGVVKIWDTETYNELITFSSHVGRVWQAKWSPDSTRIASADETGLVIVWEASTGVELSRFLAPASVASIDWSNDGSHILLTGSFNTPIIRRVWPSTQDLIDYAYDCCVTRELTLEEREQFGLPPNDN